MSPSRPAHIAIAIMMARLVEGPTTAQDIADDSGLSAQSVRGYLRALRKHRAIHIAGWELDEAGRQTLAAYALGRKQDAKRTPALSRAEIARHYRARKRDARLLGLQAQRPESQEAQA